MRVALCLLVAASGVAHADDNVAAAKAEASTAEGLAAKQMYREAAAKFRAAYRLDPNPGYICNVGVAYQRAKDLAHAQIYLVECLRKGQTLEATFLDLVRKALADVEGKLRAGEFAPVDIVVKPEGAAITPSSFEPDEKFVGSQVVWLPFGSHTVTASAEGYVPQKQTLEVHANVQQKLRFELAREPATPDRGASKAPPEIAPTKPLPVHVVEARSKVPPIVATVITVAAGGAALGTYLHARSIMDSAGDSTIDRPEYNRRKDSARSWQHASWALGGAAGVGAVVSALLWVRASHRTTVEVSPTGDGGAVSLSGSW